MAAVSSDEGTGTDFHETLPHNVVCSETDYGLWVFICLLKKIEGREAPIFANLQTQSRHFEPHHSIMVVHILSIMRGKSKTKASVHGCARMPIPKMMGVPPPMAEIGCFFGNGYGVREVNIQLVTRCLILRVGFAGQPI